MRTDAIGTSIDTLPATLPIFPLPGVLLLPGGKLPLQIFEPRYLAMTRAALAGDHLIGMIQPLDRESERQGIVPDDAALHPIGCAGRITAFSETDDGRFLITLTGVCRFAVRRELPSVDGYRRVAPDFHRFRADIEGADETIADRDRLMQALRSYFARQKIAVNFEAVAELPDDRLVTILAMACPFAAQERQALLEAHDLRERGRVMTALFELGAHADGGELRH
jgi:hypothetical protein